MPARMRLCLSCGVQAGVLYCFMFFSAAKLILVRSQSSHSASWWLGAVDVARA